MATTTEKILFTVLAGLAGFAGYEWYHRSHPTTSTTKLPPATPYALDISMGLADGNKDGTADAKAGLLRVPHPSKTHSTDPSAQAAYENAYNTSFYSAYDAAKPASGPAPVVTPSGFAVSSPGGGGHGATFEFAATPPTPPTTPPLASSPFDLTEAQIATMPEPLQSQVRYQLSDIVYPAPFPPHNSQDVYDLADIVAKLGVYPLVWKALRDRGNGLFAIESAARADEEARRNATIHDLPEPLRTTVLYWLATHSSDPSNYNKDLYDQMIAGGYANAALEYVHVYYPSFVAGVMGVGMGSAGGRTLPASLGIYAHPAYVGAQRNQSQAMAQAGAAWLGVRGRKARK